MIAKDVNIVTVKELLGHANIQTTMIYTNPNQKEVQKAYLNAIKQGFQLNNIIYIKLNLLFLYDIILLSI